MSRSFAMLAWAMILVLLATAAPARPSAVRAQDAPALPGVGDPVTFSLAEGAGEATITVTQIVDPFGTFGTGDAPEGSRFVYVALTIANGGDQPLTVDPATIFVVDTAGFVYRPAEAPGGDATDAAGQTVDPGAEVDGGIVAAVPEEAVLAAVYHDPAADRLILLALLRDQAATSDDETPPPDGEDVTPPADGEDGEDETPVVVGDVDCDAFAAYNAETRDRITRLEEIASQMADLPTLLTSDPTGIGPVVQGWSDDIAALAEEQANAEVPAGLEALNDQTVAAYEIYVDAFSQLATALAGLDVAAIQAIIPVLEEGDALLTEVIDQLDDLAEGCGIEVE
jgi:hypothetical protein